MGDLVTWRTIMLGVAALGQVVFLLLYVTFPWWRSYLGRALFARTFMLSVLMAFAWLGRVLNFGDHDLAFVVLYTFLALGIWAEFSAFARVVIKDGHRYWADHPPTNAQESKDKRADVADI